MFFVLVRYSVLFQLTLTSLDAVVVSILHNGTEECMPSIGNVRLENG